jgi:hydroxymethylpyrimidine/phosphomethylpyrimidine kinase
MSQPLSTRPVALTIAGSDSGGGAGIQADLKTFTMLGCYGATALTAVTAQNTRGVQAAALLEPTLIARQIDSVATDLSPAATKTGMLGSVDIVETVAATIRRHGLAPLVVDPVMVAKSGDSLIDDDAVDAIVRLLLPLADIVTPNRHEAARLAGFPVETVDDARRAAGVICDRFGARACVVKAVRREDADGPVSVDVFCPAPGHPDGCRLLPHPWHATGQANTHGSGCTFSAAVTAELAKGREMEAALEAAVRFIDAAMASPVRYGSGISPVDHLAGAGR